MVPTPGTSWRLALGLLAFLFWAPPSLAGLPFAALVLAAVPRRPLEWWAAGLAASASLALILLPNRGLLSATVGAYAVLVTAAFVLVTLYWPGRFLARALRATALAGIATTALAWALVGGGFWAGLHREASRAANLEAQRLLGDRIEVLAMLDPLIRLASDMLPALLVLQTLAGLALAWQWHQRVSTKPLGEPLGAFRELRFSDHWVWGVVAAVAVWVAPWLAGLQTAALNLAVVTGALYLLRGAAIVAAFAEILGVSTGALVLGAAVTTVLTVPLLVLVPGLWTLGLTDTWLEFRRRLAARQRPEKR
ncbi:MAG TPA: DUF2232 domain-containing protein [Gemmatimonadales bacterium]